MGADTGTGNDEEKEAGREMGEYVKTGKDGAVLPLLLREPGGRVVRMEATNEKGFHKSIERGELWCVNRETGRLLPLDGGGVMFRDLRIDGDESTGGSWYQAELSGASSGRASEAGTRTGGADGQADGSGFQTSGPATSAQAIISELEDLIRERKESLPEGSYTTHLFTRGNDKIRKKTGEEAVELLLARGHEEIVSEASDLIYHLLVLLVDEGVSFDEIGAELARRHGNG